MDGSPGLITGLAATVGTIASAWINRGAAAGVKELREQIEKAVTGPDGRLTKLEAQVAAALGAPGTPPPWKLAADEIRGHVNSELAAAKTLVDALRRDIRGQRQQQQPRGREPSLPSIDEELARMLGMDEIRRRVDDLERSRSEERREDVELQKTIAAITTQLELLIDGKIQLPGGKGGR